MKTVLKSEDWTFYDDPTQNYTHGLHLYPARMHPKIAGRLISDFAKDRKKVIFDPFMGSGGVLVESFLHGNNSVGFDINPFAHLLSKVKTTPISTKKLEKEYNHIISEFSNDLSKGHVYENAPDHFDLSFWYGSDVVDKLTILKEHVFSIPNKNVRDFFKICFSLTTRKSSYQNGSIYKIYRMKPEKREKFNPDPFKIFSDICKRNISKMGDFVEAADKIEAKSYPILGDTRNVSEEFKNVPSEILDDGKAHLVVTSPPYGDHGTTVAYGQFSRHPGLWLDMDKDKLLPVDSVGLGGKKKDDDLTLKSDLLNDTIEEIRKRDEEVMANRENGKGNNPNRAKDVFAFFYDLDECFKNISTILKPNKSYCCFVVANRKVRRLKIPTNEIIIDLAEEYGFKYQYTIPRTIAKKAMAVRNTPENVSDYTDETMNDESIVVWKF